jgi:hypothetical protein
LFLKKENAQSSEEKVVPGKEQRASTAGQTHMHREYSEKSQPRAGTVSRGLWLFCRSHLGVLDGESRGQDLEQGYCWEGVCCNSGGW